MAAALAAVALVAAGIVFFLPAGNSTIRVEINDPEVEVALTSKGIKIKGTDKQGDIDALLRLSIVLFALDFTPGRYREALQRLEQSLERSRGTVSTTRVHVLNAATVKPRLRNSDRIA